ncbi:transaminase [Lithospermum erythrorhizon]|uniref:Transaminase n=1 Tax=Lithospermum erythrorhizon TaxID=34254 RepID=A0AAV3RNV7_LITER
MEDEKETGVRLVIDEVTLMLLLKSEDVNFLKEVSDAIEFGDHGSTFAVILLVCHASIVTLDKISDPSLLVSISTKGKHLEELLVQKLGSNSHVKEVAVHSFIIGIELNVSASALEEAC